jgi:Transglutaminase-like superfamily
MREMPGTQHFLHPDAFVCRIEDGAVLLDLTRNKYFAIESHDALELDRHLNGGEIPDMASDGNGHLDNPRVEFISALVERGLLVSYPSLHKGTNGDVVAPTRSLTSMPNSSSQKAPQLAQLGHIAWALTHVRLNLRLRRLRSLVHYLRRWKLLFEIRSSPDTASFDELVDLVIAFRKLRPWLYTATNRCLLDALVLTEFLFQHNYFPTFVIGVDTKPFCAHAWVQMGDCVLDDRVERVQNFTPILTI